MLFGIFFIQGILLLTVELGKKQIIKNSSFLKEPDDSTSFSLQGKIECLLRQWITSQLNLSKPCGYMRKHNVDKSGESLDQISCLTKATLQSAHAMLSKISHNREFLSENLDILMSDTQCVKCSKCQSLFGVYFGGFSKPFIIYNQYSQESLIWY